MLAPLNVNQGSIATETLQEMVNKAIDARNNAYCPYSEYSVGAAILTESGKIFAGCNVENASYSGTICAERSALFSAVSAGSRDIKAVVIVLNAEASPCGFCRQALYEFNPEAYIYAATPEGTIYNSWRLDELLPHGFGPKHLAHILNK